MVAVLPSLLFFPPKPSSGPALLLLRLVVSAPSRLSRSTLVLFTHPVACVRFDVVLVYQSFESGFLFGVLDPLRPRIPHMPFGHHDGRLAVWKLVGLVERSVVYNVSWLSCANAVLASRIADLLNGYRRHIKGSVVICGFVAFACYVVRDRVSWVGSVGYDVHVFWQWVFIGTYWRGIRGE
jgi:hypothetical protein